MNNPIRDKINLYDNIEVSNKNYSPTYLLFVTSMNMVHATLVTTPYNSKKIPTPKKKLIQK